MNTIKQEHAGTHQPSFNACAQALKRLKPGITQKEFFKILGVPKTFMTTSRYWEEYCNIKAWDDREEYEKHQASYLVRKVLGINYERCPVKKETVRKIFNSGDKVIYNGEIHQVHKEPFWNGFTFMCHIRTLEGTYVVTCGQEYLQRYVENPEEKA